MILIGVSNVDVHFVNLIGIDLESCGQKLGNLAEFRKCYVLKITSQSMFPVYPDNRKRVINIITYCKLVEHSTRPRAISFGEQCAPYKPQVISRCKRRIVMWIFCADYSRPFRVCMLWLESLWMTFAKLTRPYRVITNKTHALPHLFVPSSSAMCRNAVFGLNVSVMT